MMLEAVGLPDTVEHQAMKLLADITEADSALDAIKAQARAEGLVLGLKALGLLHGMDIANLLVVFESALERRLEELITR
ncbi:MAG: hypothetical protein JWP80_2001 [Pseudomonas sp.]|nr:hypothetical protein [Pseudomonas sp.]